MKPPYQIPAFLVPRIQESLKICCDILSEYDEAGYPMALVLELLAELLEQQQAERETSE
jgi:hypothetical protein